MPKNLPASANVSGIEDVILVLAVPQARADYLGRPELDANEVASERERVADQTLFNRIERSSVEKKSLGSELLLRAEHPGDQYPAGDRMLRQRPRVAKRHQTNTPQKTEELAVFGAIDQKRWLRDQTTDTRGIELLRVFGSTRKSERGAAIGA